MRVVGAGLGRTGTNSLKVALEHLLGKPCYHMFEVLNRPDDVARWQAAIDGAPPDWGEFFDGWGAVVDWPASAFYDQLAEAFPESLVLLSTRSTESWFRSADTTIFAAQRERLDSTNATSRMVRSLMEKTFVPATSDKATMTAAFEQHNDRVRASIPADRLLEWQPGDGWAPICDRLGLAIPDEPFPHVNSSDDFQRRLDEARGEP